MRKSIAIVVLLLSLGLAAQAANFSVSLDRNTIRLGEEATLSLTFEGGQPSVVPEVNVAGLDFANPVSTQNSSDINGVMSFTVTISYAVVAHQAGGFVPLAGREGIAQGIGDSGDVIEVSMDLTVGIDVAFGYLPVVDAGIAGRAGVRKYEACIEIRRIDRERGAGDADGSEFDGGDASVEGGVIILRAGGDADHLGFDVLGDFANFLWFVLAAGDSVEG